MLPSGGEHAVVWRGGQPTDLGAPDGLDSTATLVSSRGTIFGFASQGASVAGVLEWKSGTLVDLGSFGAPAAQPIAMNARGDVLVSTGRLTRARELLPLGDVRSRSREAGSSLKCFLGQVLHRCHR